MAHEHDRFLGEREDALHFGCVNPFCGHGNPALPNHYKVPLESKDVTMKLLSHENDLLKIEVTPKDPQYGPAILECEDNFEACGQAFGQLSFPVAPSHFNDKS